MTTKIKIPDALYISGVTSVTLGLFASPSALSEPSDTDVATLTAGQIGAPNGTVAAPAVTFASDLDTGMYRIGANNLGIGVNGAVVQDVRTVGVYVTGNVAHGAVSAFATTEPVSAATFKQGTAPAGAVTTSGGIFTNGTVVQKIIAAGTVSNVET